MCEMQGICRVLAKRKGINQERIRCSLGIQFKAKSVKSVLLLEIAVGLSGDFFL